MVTSFPPRPCGIATFAEEALEFIRKHMPRRPIHIISHTDGRGDNVHPIIDISREDWYLPVAQKIRELNPYVVHLEHEYGLYNYVDPRGRSDNNSGFIRLLEEISDFPTVVEPHTVHGRMRYHEEAFIRAAAERATALIFKCSYQKWRLEWMFSQRRWPVPENIVIIPHGARPDYAYPPGIADVLKEELGLSALKGKRLAGLVGWIQNNKRWDVVIDMWEEVHSEIVARTGERWLLFGAGDMRDPAHKKDFEAYVGGLRELEKKGLACFYRFTPRGDRYYKVMAICDFVILPTVDETQSGTLARIIALNKPYVTTAPLEGLTSQTIESGGGLLFTDKDSLRQRIIRLGCDEDLRWILGESLKRYLRKVVSWDIVAQRYLDLHRQVHQAKISGKPFRVPPEF